MTTEPSGREDLAGLLRMLASRLVNRWKLAGQEDPHGYRYLCDFGQISGEMNTDDELANAVYLNPDITNLTFAKDRIRWHSRRLDEAHAAIIKLVEENAKLRGERDALKQQAQSWSMEAKTQKATVHECLQAASGATGEKADWNGAAPVRRRIDRLKEALRLAKDRLELLCRVYPEDGAVCDHPVGTFYVIGHAASALRSDGEGYQTMTEEELIEGLKKL